VFIGTKMRITLTRVCQWSPCCWRRRLPHSSDAIERSTPRSGSTDGANHFNRSRTSGRLRLYNTNGEARCLSSAGRPTVALFSCGWQKPERRTVPPESRSIRQAGFSTSLMRATAESIQFSIKRGHGRPGDSGPRLGGRRIRELSRSRSRLVRGVTSYMSPIPARAATTKMAKMAKTAKTAKTAKDAKTDRSRNTRSTVRSAPSAAGDVSRQRPPTATGYSVYARRQIRLRFDPGAGAIVAFAVEPPESSSWWRAPRALAISRDIPG